MLKVFLRLRRGCDELGDVTLALICGAMVH
jgi:hypothetical protein